MSGIGLQGAGTTSAGFGTSSAASTFTGGLLRDEKTGKTLGARRIDPVTRDYATDTYGRVLGLSAARGAVQMSVHTELNSSAVRAMGQDLRKIDRITPNIQKQVLDKLTACLQPLIDRGMIAVLGFDTFKAGDDRNGLQRGATYGRLLWKDLSTDTEQQELI